MKIDLKRQFERFLKFNLFSYTIPRLNSQRLNSQLEQSMDEHRNLGEYLFTNLFIYSHTDYLLKAHCTWGIGLSAGGTK